jgi:hypothetical protein
MITIKPFDITQKAIWNSFVNDKSLNGTIFHHLDFLAYHQNRFTSILKVKKKTAISFMALTQTKKKE